MARYEIGQNLVSNRYRYDDDKDPRWLWKIRRNEGHGYYRIERQSDGRTQSIHTNAIRARYYEYDRHGKSYSRSNAEMKYIL